jgi:hypothetical protein
LLNKDYKDMLSALNDASAEYLIVGAFALAAHGNPRATVDIDIWVRSSAENAKKVWKALETFGAPRSKLSVEDFLELNNVFQIGVAPRRIDILTSIDGVDFEQAWIDRKMSTLGDDLIVPVLGRAHLIINKYASGRPKDLVDADWLEQQAGED